MGLIRFEIRNFRGIVALVAEPNGRSVTFRGANGSGKTAAIDALWWALGGVVDGEVVKNGADRAEVEIVIDGYAVRRQKAPGKKPTLTVKSADGKTTFNSPTALLSGFVAAVERRTFSVRPEKDREDILRKLAPGLDCGDLVAGRARAFDARTEVNRDAKSLRAQAAGVVIPEAPEAPGEERPIVDVVDVVDIAARKAPIERQRAKNDAERARARQVAAEASVAHAASAKADRAVEEARATLARLEREADAARTKSDGLAAESAEIEAAAATLVDPDPTEIDREIAAAREANATARAEAEAHNRAVRAAQAQRAERQRAEADRARLIAAAEAKEAESARLTEAIDRLDAEKVARIAAAKLPIDGIALGDAGVTFDDGVHGAVAIDALNSATRIRLDVAIAAALGHRLIAIRDASLLDSAGRADVARFAEERGVQLLAEIVTDGGSAVEAVIEDADTESNAPQSDLFS